MAERLCSKKAAVAAGEDHLSTLPEDVIQMVLSLLPSRQAVQTCVLATHWRTLWKSVPSLRADADDEAYRCCQDLKCFIDSFLRYRDPTPLHKCEILFDHHRDTEEFHQDFEMWLRYAVSRKVRILRFEILAGHDPLQLSAGVLISQHLTRLILRHVEFEDFSLDVSGCQSLEVLEMHECVVNIGTVLPKSLQHLTIRDTSFGPQDTRCLTSAPGLVSLEVADCHGWTPLFKSLPSLEAALINTTYVLKGSCGNSFNGYCGHELCVVCHGRDDCVFLEGLSGATNLELIAEYFMEWYGNTSETYNPKDQFLVSKHLKAVEINHVKDDKRIRRLLKILASHGVHSELINIEEKYHS